MLPSLHENERNPKRKIHMSNANLVAQRPVEALRSVLPTLQEAFGDVVVRFLANHWSPIRVVDETNDSTPRIWLRALNIGVIYDDGYVIRLHPKKYARSEKTTDYRVTDSKELLQLLWDFIGPYQI